jgi:aryl-alcohol dehydrogenase-like predicted oxidoreductase
VKKRPLGCTGIEVSEIAFGGVEIGMPYGIGITSEKEMPKEKEAIYLLHKAQEEGINFYDTARMYGNSEAIMGKAFKERRNQIVLGTKCRHLRDRNGKLPSGSALANKIIGSLEKSLLALQTDYLDVFMLHQTDKEILENDEIAASFTELKRSGKVRSIGVSTYSLEDTRLAMEKRLWEVIQLPFNLIDQRQARLFEEAFHKGIGLVVRSVLLKGLLSDKGKNLPTPLKEVEGHIQKYEGLMKGNEWDLPTLAVKFALSFGQISSVLVGIDKEKYLYHALTAGDGNYLNAEVLTKAKKLEFPNPEFIDLPYWAKIGWLP